MMEVDAGLGRGLAFAGDDAERIGTGRVGVAGAEAEAKMAPRSSCSERVLLVDIAAGSGSLSSAEETPDMLKSPSEGVRW